MRLWFRHQEAEAAFGLRALDDLGSHLRGEVRHIDTGHWVVGQEPDLPAGGRVLQRAPQAQRRNWAKMPAGIDEDFFSGHGLGLHQPDPEGEAVLGDLADRRAFPLVLQEGPASPAEDESVGRAVPPIGHRDRAGALQQPASAEPKA